MEKGSMRIEPNISLREISKVQKESQVLPQYKVELKNINSFRFAERAINYEFERQSKILESGQIPDQETRGWDEKNNRTVSQRTKELAHDYRYFPEPDLTSFTFSQAYIKQLQNQLPELPDEKLRRFKDQYQLSQYDAMLLTGDSALANFYEEAVKAYKGKNPKKVANWVCGELLRRLNESSQTINQISLLPASLTELLYLVDQGQITTSKAKEIFEQMFATGKNVTKVVRELKVGKLSTQELEKIIDGVISANLKAVADYQNGKSASLEFLIGQVQRQTKGQADPAHARRLILEKIKN